jgi:hypothetical protein
MNDLATKFVFNNTPGLRDSPEAVLGVFIFLIIMSLMGLYTLRQLEVKGHIEKSSNNKVHYTFFIVGLIFSSLGLLRNLTLESPPNKLLCFEVDYQKQGGYIDLKKNQHTTTKTNSKTRVGYLKNIRTFIDLNDLSVINVNTPSHIKYQECTNRDRKLIKDVISSITNFKNLTKD